MVTQWTELTDSQWEVIENIFADQEMRIHSVRTILDAILWIVRTGSQWRNLDRLFPPWQSVYHHFRRWKTNGKLEAMNTYLVAFERYCSDRKDYASQASIDSQSIKLAPFINLAKGYDGNKKVNGRKRHVLVDTLGLVLGVHISGANSSDGEEGCILLDKAKSSLLEVKRILGDGAYRKTFENYASKDHGIEVVISSRPPSVQGFIPLKWRWVSERTFGWFNFFRRLDKDHERTAESSAAMILLASSQIILSRFKG